MPSEEVPSKASASVKAGGPPPAFPSLEPESGKPKGFLGKPGNASPPLGFSCLERLVEPLFESSKITRWFLLEYRKEVVDGFEIRHSPVDMVVEIPLFLGFYTSKRWLGMGLLPSKVSKGHLMRPA